MRRAPGHPSHAAVKPAGSVAPVPAPPPSPEMTARRLRFLDGLLVAVVLLFAFLTALYPVYHSDFFLHAATGRLLAHGEYQFGADPFAFTTAGVYWVNHSWLYDLVLYLIFTSSAAGGTILIVLKALMIAALAEVMLRTARAPGRSLWLPAGCVGLAVLAVSPRLLLQPVCVSFFFLGLTCWLLGLPRQRRLRAAEGPIPRRPFLPYWLIPPLCLLWVNLDDWFLLGPATVALYLLGDVLENGLNPIREGPESPAPGERRALLLVLIASVAACLVNPHFYRAFALPSELGLSEAGGALGRDAQFQPLFLSPFEIFTPAGMLRYYRAGLVSVAGFAYFPLALLSAASFAAALRVGRPRWPRVVLWAAFFALSAWHARAVPFFAVVAGPITALNFLDFAGRRTAAEPPGAWAFAGRVLTLLVGVALAALTWSGLLEAQPEYHRLGWTVEPNPGLKEMAERVAAWRADGRIEPDGRWFNMAPEALHYLAWYCPGERGFIDQRLSLYDQAAADYTSAANSLATGGDAGASDPAWRKVLRVNGAKYLIWSGSLRLPVLNTSPLWRLFGSPKEWPLLFMNGHTAVFGWRDPSKADGATSDPFARIEYDGDRLAFGPDALPVPPGPTPEPTPRGWWNALWTREPLRPSEADEAAAQLILFESLRPTWRTRNEPAWKDHWAETKRRLQIEVAVACLGPAGGCGAVQAAGAAHAWTLIREDPPPLPSFPPKPGEEDEYLVARGLFDFGPPSALYLGVRAARRSLALRPDDAPTYEALAQSYMVLGRQTREGDGLQTLRYPALLRQVQIAAALRRALDLDPDRDLALGLSFLLYQQNGFVDLATNSLKERLRVLRERGERETELKQLGDQVGQMEKDKDNRVKTYELRAAGKPDVARAEVAMQVGLGGEALEVLEKTDWTKLDKNDPNKLRGAVRELTLLLRTGRAEEVRKELVDQETSLKDELGADPDTGLPAYEWLRVEAAAAAGDYAEADRWLEALRNRTRAGLVRSLHDLGVIDDPAAAAQPELPSLAALLTGHLVLREAPSAVGAAPWLQPNMRLPMLSAHAGEIAGLMGLQCDVEAVRGWLALEAGRTDAARGHFRNARDRASPDTIPFRGRALTDTCLEWLNAAK